MASKQNAGNGKKRNGQQGDTADVTLIEPFQLPPVSTGHNPSPLLTEIEAAKYLRRSRTTLIRIRKKGGIEFTRIEDGVFYTQAQLDSYIAKCAKKERA